MRNQLRSPLVCRRWLIMRPDRLIPGADQVITPTLSASGSSESPKKSLLACPAVLILPFKYLLQQAGHEVSGLFMKNWEEDGGADLYRTGRSGRRTIICDSLGIELLTANFAAEYWDNVFEHFLAEYRSGRTLILTCSAPGRSNSRLFWTMRTLWGPTV